MVAFNHFYLNQYILYKTNHAEAMNNKCNGVSGTNTFQ